MPFQAMKVLNSIINLFRFNNRNWKAVVLCVITAMVFWFFNALNKNYSANINFPLSFEFDKENFIPLRALPHSVRINVSGQGWDLFRKSLGLKVPPLSIPLEYPTEVRKIVGASLPALFSPQIEGLQINFVLTDTIHVQLDKKVKREVFVAVGSTDQHVENGFGRSGKVVVQPNVVTLQGPQSLLNAMQDTIWLTLPSGKVDQNFSDDVEVNIKSDLISRNPPVVKVSFPVDRLMVITDTVGLKIRNLPREIRSAVLVKDIRYTYSLPVRLAHTITPEEVSALIDLSGMPRGRHKVVPVLSGLPPYSKLIQVDTVDVNF